MWSQKSRVFSHFGHKWSNKVGTKWPKTAHLHSFFFFIFDTSTWNFAYRTRHSEKISFFGGKIIIITKLKPNVLTEICQSNQTLSLTKVWISLNGGGCLWEKSTIKTNAGLTDQLQINITLAAKIRQIETKLVDFFMTIFGKSTTEYLVKVSLIN